jgi:hypothetical protein
MTTFHTIAIPHDDILQGRLTMDVFAADLWDVFKERGSDEYKSADLFFQKTYETEGLKTLLEVVKSRLKGKGGDPVLQIQTPFGGGKTHALIAMYHKAAEWGAKRVVMVGTAMSAKDTLWGLIEHQLTGKQKKFAGLTSPGRTDEFRELLASQGPVLILFDELLEYVTKAAGVPVAESTLASQAIAFMQELTELVSTLEKVVLVVTLPSSLMEHFDARSEQLFQQLQRVSGRVEKIYTPVQENEITQVIRCRLFSSVDKKAAAKEIAAFMDYAGRESLLPAGVEASEYRQRFEASYPFLPDVVDVLYQRWGSFSTFQRTRGVLRLLALVVHGLKDRNLPYISLADFDLSNQEIRQELLKHIGAEFNSVIAADITAPDAGSRKVSVSLGKAYQGLRLGERVTTATFMYSFSGGVERGATMADIKRNATTLENPSAVVAEAVEELKGRLFYIQNQVGKYFFSNQANLNRLLLTRMENIHDPEITEVEESLLRGRIKGDKLKVHIWREQTSDIPDTQDLKLLLFAEPDEIRMRSFLEEKGGTPRVHRNTIFFLVPMPNERTAFENLVRKHLAFKGLSDDQTLKLTADQNKEIKDSLKRLDGDLSESVRRLYRQLYLPARTGWKEIDLGLPTVGDNKSLDQEVYDRLRMDGEILEKIAPLVIKEKYLKDRDWVSTSQLYQASLKTPGETRALNQAAWDSGIAEGVRKGLFGLGELKEDQPVCRYYIEEASTFYTDDEILLKAEICEAQRAAQEGKVTFGPGQTATGPSTGETTPSQTFGQSTFVPPTPVAGKYQQLHFNFVVPKGKVSSLMGVLNYLQSRYNRLELSVNVGEGQLTEQEYEDKVKEAFRQMGIDID